MKNFEAKVRLNTVKDVQRFVAAMDKIPNEKVTLSRDVYCVDARSIMGVFSLNLSEPVTLKIVGDVSQNVLDSIACFVVK